MTGLFSKQWNVPKHMMLTDEEYDDYYKHREFIKNGVYAGYRQRVLHVEVVREAVSELKKWDVVTSFMKTLVELTCSKCTEDFMFLYMKDDPNMKLCKLCLYREVFGDFQPQLKSSATSRREVQK